MKRLEKIREEGEDDRLQDEMKIMKVVETEMLQLIHDEQELMTMELPIISQLKKMASQPKEEEEVLQTKVISPQEVAARWEEWIQLQRRRSNQCWKKKRH